MPHEVDFTRIVETQASLENHEHDFKRRPVIFLAGFTQRHVAAGDVLIVDEPILHARTFFVPG